MALEQVTVEYNIQTGKAKAQFEELVRSIQQGEQKIIESAKNANKTILSDEDKAFGKRKKLIKEEESELQNLEKRKKRVYSPEDIREYNKTLEETSKKVKKVGTESNGLEKSNGNLITSFKNIAGAVGIAFGVQQLLAFGKELLEIDRKSQGVNRAFNNIANSQDLAALRASTGFGVTDLELKQLAVRANLFKISLDKLPTLLKFATVRAAETGQEVDYLVNSIIDGIGRQSPLILDNLGLSAADVREEFKNTGDMATAVANIIDRDMANSVTSIDDATSASQKLDTTWINLKNKFAEGFAAQVNPILEAVNDASQSLGNFITNTNEITLAIKLYGRENGIAADKTEMIIKAFERFGTVNGDVINAVTQLRGSFNGLKTELSSFTEIDQFIDKGVDLRQQMERLDEVGLKNGKTYTELKIAFDLVTDAFNKFNRTTGEEPQLTETLKMLNEELTALKEKFETTDISSALFRTLQQQIKDLEARIESIVNPTNKGSIAALEAEITKLVEKQKQLNTTTEASIKKYADLQNKINELQRNISELRRLGDPLAQFNIQRIGEDIEVSNKQLKQLEEIMAGVADKTLTASQMLKKFDEEIKNLKKSAGSEVLPPLISEETIKRQEEFNAILTSSVTTLVGDLTGLFNSIGEQQDEAINRQLEGERQRAQEHFDIMRGIWQSQLDNGQITKEELFNQETAYNEKINALEARQAELRKQQLRKQAIAEKANASFQLIVGTTTAVAKNLANPPAIIAIIAAAAAQLAILAATPIPEFAKGVVGLQGAGTETSDSIHAKLSKGESVITAKATRQNKDALTAMNKGEYEKYVQQTYIMPALEVKRQQQRNSFAESIATSMQSGTYDDSLLIHETRKNKAVSIRNADQIGKATARELGRNSYFKNRV